MEEEVSELRLNKFFEFELFIKNDVFKIMRPALVLLSTSVASHSSTEGML